MNSNQTQNPQSNPKPEVPVQFWLARDEDWGIYIFNDHHNNLGIQVAQFWTQTRKEADGSITNLGEQPNVIWTKLVPTNQEDANKKTVVRDPMQFKAEVDKAMGEAKYVIEQQKMKRNLVAGYMNNYWHQAKALNEKK